MLFLGVSPRPCATKRRFGLRFGPVWPLAVCPDSVVLRTPFSKKHSGLAPVWSGLAYLTAGAKRFDCAFTRFHCRATPAHRVEPASGPTFHQQPLVWPTVWPLALRLDSDRPRAERRRVA